nr:MAG TPA_asm: hypothetical protein [Caudoviricetes sp.]
MPRKQKFSGLYFCARGCIMFVQPNSVPQVLPDAEEGKRATTETLEKRARMARKKSITLAEFGEIHFLRAFLFSRGEEEAVWSRWKTHKTYTTAR